MSSPSVLLGALSELEKLLSPGTPTTPKEQRRLPTRAMLLSLVTVLVLVVILVTVLHICTKPIPPLPTRVPDLAMPTQMIHDAGIRDAGPLIIYGFDNDRNKAKYGVLVLDIEYLGYVWEFGKWDKIRYSGRLSVIEEYFKTNPSFEQFVKLGRYGLIAVGSASEEGVAKEEADRARQRATELRRQLLNAQYNFGDEQHKQLVYTLNLGKCNGSRSIPGCIGSNAENSSSLLNGIETSCQRALIIIAIMEEHGHVRHEEALKDAMRREENLRKLPYDVGQDFDLFDLQMGPARRYKKSVPPS